MQFVSVKPRSEKCPRPLAVVTHLQAVVLRAVVMLWELTEARAVVVLSYSVAQSSSQRHTIEC